MNPTRAQSLPHRTVSSCQPLAVLLPVFVFAFTLGNVGSAAAQSAGNFKLDAVGARSAKLGYFPVPIKLLDAKPADVKQEPAYAGTPKYGVFNVGDGPRSTHYLALDEPTKGTWKIHVELQGDGKWGLPLDVRSPFKLGDKNYVADLAPDGSAITFTKTTRKAPAPPPPPKALLAAGATAPDFEAEAWGGGALHLADYKGKVVVLDFWSTWCGPCQKSMPHIEKIYQATKAQKVVVLGVCVWDDQAACSKWVPEKQDVSISTE